MGSYNALSAFTLYAGKVPPLSMQLLTYMALVSRDGETRPWFGQGHAALANAALGRGLPVSEADLRAVRRGIGPLLAIGAIRADRKAAPNRDSEWTTVRYRLNLSLQLSMDLTVHNPVDATVDGEPTSMA